jgi:hypothetical protein
VPGQLVEFATQNSIATAGCVDDGTFRGVAARDAEFEKIEEQARPFVASQGQGQQAPVAQREGRLVSATRVARASRRRPSTLRAAAPAA